MRWLRNFSWTLQIALLVSSISAFAQRVQPLPGQWIGDLYLVDHIDGIGTETVTKKYILIDDDNKVYSVHPEIKIPIDFDAPKEYGSFAPYMYWHDDALYALANTPGLLEENEDGSRFERWNFIKWKEGEWHFLGDYKQTTNESTWLRFIPCDNDRFIVVSGSDDLTGNTGPERTPFFKMSIRGAKKNVVLDSPIDHGMDDLREHMLNPVFFRIAANCSFVITDKHATLVSPLTGLYWVFSLEKASLVRAGKIISKITPEVIAKFGYLDAILSVNPEKGGTVLISAQHEAALTTEIGSTFEEIIKLATENPDLSEQEAMQLFYERQKDLAKRNPDIVWYRIHPESGGRLEKLATPPVGAALVRDEVKNDDWRPLSDGSVRMGPIAFNASEKAKKPDQKDSDAKDDENEAKPLEGNKDGTQIIEDDKTSASPLEKQNK